jgi:hypothetical protein
MLVKQALGDKAAHCPLALCAFTNGKAQNVNALQVKQFLNAFYQKSCLDTDSSGLKKDIFAQATLGKIDRIAVDGQLKVTEILPFAGAINGVRTFLDAERVTRELLKLVTPHELKEAAKVAQQGKPPVPYSAWIEKFATQIQNKLNLGNANSLKNKMQCKM